MKVFEVVTEHVDGDEIKSEIQYVTSKGNTLQSVCDYFTTHCFAYNKELKSVREVLVVTEQLP